MNLRTGEDVAERASYAVMLVICLVMLLTIPLLFDRGIDLTDEGAYLNSIGNPSLYPFSVSMYGALLHPFLAASGYSIVFLRLVNYVLLVLATLILVMRASHVIGLDSQLSKLSRAGLWAAFTSSALFFYCIWLPTPNYNSVNVFGALLLAYAVVGINSSEIRLGVREIIVGGIGLSLCALAKPTAGAALAVVLIGSSLGAGRSYFRSVLGIGLVSVVLCGVFLLLTRGSPVDIVQSYQKGVVLTEGFFGDRSTIDIFFWRSFPFPPELLYMAIVAGIGTLLFFATEVRVRLGRWTIFVEFGAFTTLFALGVWVQFDADWWNRPLNWTPFLFATTFALWGVGRHYGGDKKYNRVIVTLLLIPFAVGFGSATGILRSATQAATIWSVASLFVLASVFDRAMLRSCAVRVAIASVGAVAIVIAWALIFPQRQAAPLWDQHTWMPAHGRERALRVDSGTAEYFRVLLSAAQAGGFKSGTAVIDLTGTSPTTIYVLGGDAIGDPYLSGGWPGSEMVVDKSLGSVPRGRLEHAWVLTSSGTSDAVNPRVLLRHGLNFPRGYEAVGQATPPTAGGEQTLWKPKI